MVHLVVVDGHEDRTVLPEQFAQELETGQHHAAPLVVAGQVVAVHDPAQPVPHQGEFTLSLYAQPSLPVL